ncbi:predicted protein [Histoplasma mississippiense (nom. inval.)]|uniref:predicted protein n=1 Tax=Ajellomyces capsulatus (strain NAm1 / WU24) TaxID=2059318 RepID=UPI000157B37E|nr:predicted protein [Histoplasma mississippiense (nom. inval.)]EDN03188.1 predicted protein [Histoplasma mississippiense (nom. inval.)]
MAILTSAISLTSPSRCCSKCVDTFAADCGRGGWPMPDDVIVPLVDDRRSSACGNGRALVARHLN